MISLKSEPAFISASEQPIVITLTEDDNSVTSFDYTTYIRIYKTADTNIQLAGASKITPVLLKELTLLSKSRNSSYDISNILQTEFQTWTNINGHYIIWKDFNASFGYFIEFGEVTYSATQQAVYTQLGETEVKWCIRAATTVAERVAFADADSPALPLNLTPDYSEQTRNTLINYPFLLPLPIGQETGYAAYLKANLTFDDGVNESNKLITKDIIQDGGVYNYTLLPSQLVAAPERLALLNGVELWVEWYEDTPGSGGGSTGGSYLYYSTATRTATCPAGTVGSSSTRTATATSNVSQADADQQAAAAATAAATAALVCATQYTATKSYTATCSGGMVGNPVTKSATATSLLSQADADAKALAAATTAANAALQCSAAPTYTSTQSYTATCATLYPDGEHVGNDCTRSATRTSTVSQADADTIALAAAQSQAEADIQCELRVWSCYYGTGTYQCFSGDMIDQFGNTRGCTYAEGQRCWIDDDGHGPGSCGTNPYP